jgi:hypothetical protein
MRARLTATSRAIGRLAESVLVEFDVEVFTTDYLTASTRSDPAAGWEGTDIVVAVLDSADWQGAHSVYMTAGIGVGRGLPLLVLTDDEASSLNIWPESAVVSRVNLNSRDALEFHIRLFVERARRKAATRSSKASSPPTTSDVAKARRQLHEVRASAPGRRGQLFEEWVAVFFRASGLDVAESSQKLDLGFDLVVSLSSQAPTLDPIVFELKSTNSQASLLDAAHRLQQIVFQERASLGVVLFDDFRLPAHFAPQELPLVALLGADELLQRTESAGSVAQVLIDLRNRLVHGA